jgi:hypothetical protein
MIPVVSEADLLALFETGHEVLKAEKVLKQANIALRLLPAPAGLATGCALAIRFAADQRPAFEAELSAAGVPPKIIYRKEQDGWSVA